MSQGVLPPAGGPDPVVVVYLVWTPRTVPRDWSPRGPPPKLVPTLESKTRMWLLEWTRSHMRRLFFFPIINRLDTRGLEVGSPKIKLVVGTTVFGCYSYRIRSGLGLWLSLHEIFLRSLILPKKYNHPLFYHYFHGHIVHFWFKYRDT